MGYHTVDWLSHVSAVICDFSAAMGKEPLDLLTKYPALQTCPILWFVKIAVKKIKKDICLLCRRVVDIQRIWLCFLSVKHVETLVGVLRNADRNYTMMASYCNFPLSSFSFVSLQVSLGIKITGSMVVMLHSHLLLLRSNDNLCSTSFRQGKLKCNVFDVSAIQQGECREMLTSTKYWASHRIKYNNTVYKKNPLCWNLNSILYRFLVWGSGSRLANNYEQQMFFFISGKKLEWMQWNIDTRRNE